MTKDQERQLLERVDALEKRLAAHERISALILTSEANHETGRIARQLALVDLAKLITPSDPQAESDLHTSIEVQMRAAMKRGREEHE